MEPVDEQPVARWYLSHSLVIQMDRTTMKTHVVFDASAGVSLNDLIYRGPELQQALFDVSLWRYSTALICDITEICLQIMICPKDRDFYGEIWIMKSVNMNSLVLCLVHHF